MTKLSRKWIGETIDFVDNGYDELEKKCASEEKRANLFFTELTAQIENRLMPNCILNKSRNLSVILPTSLLATQSMANFRCWGTEQGLMMSLGTVDGSTALLISPASI